MSINLYKKRTKNGQPVLEELLSKDSTTVADKPLVYDSTNNNVKSTNDLNVNSVTASCFHGPLDGTAKNATCFNNKTYAEACADILSGCAADSNKLNGKTYSEVCADILSGTAANSTCFAGKTCTEWKEIIKTTCVDNAALATNATCFNGCTYAQACADIRDGLATQTCADAIQACADFIQCCVTAIESKIPDQASASNQLADKDFVNSSITTNTANFRGTYACVAELPSTGNTNNDYAFVCSLNTTTGNYIYDRYKWVASDSCWVCEYELNTTGFTAEQLASINSGITSSLVAKITDVYDNTVTVCMNGECKGSFNLNQNTDVCIDLGYTIRNACCANYATRAAQASSATNATCFDGCTYACAKEDIRNGMAAAISIGDSCPYQADGNRVVHIPAYPPDLSSCDGLDCTGTVTQIKVGITAYDPVSGIVSLPEYPTIPTTVCTAECANTVKRNVADCSGSCHLALFDGNTAVNDASLYVSNSKTITYSPVTGCLSTCCVRGVSGLIAGNPIGCSSTVLGQAGTYVSSGSLELYTTTPSIDFHVNNATADFTQRLIACCGLLRAIVSDGTGCTAAENTACFDFCSDGTLKATRFCGIATSASYATNATCACCASKVDVSFNTGTNPTLHYLLIAGNYPEGHAYSVQSADCLYVVPSQKRLYTCNLCSLGCAELNDVCAINLCVYNDIDGNIENAWCFSGRTYASAKADILAGTASNATCFNGCTYSCAKADIRNGLISDIGVKVYCGTTCKCTLCKASSLCLGSNAFNSTAFTTCTGTVTGISLNGCAFTVNNGAASLTGFKPATAGVADSATNSTCFNGCTYAQACSNIRSGLTSCTGTVTVLDKSDTAYPIAICTGATSVGKSSGCSFTYDASTGEINNLGSKLSAYCAYVASPNNTNRYLLVDFGNKNSTGIIQIYNATYNFGKSDSGSSITGFINYGNLRYSHLGSEHTPSTCMWLAFTGYRPMNIFADTPVSIKCNTTTAPTGITFSNPYFLTTCTGTSNYVVTTKTCCAEKLESIPSAANTSCTALVIAGCCDGSQLSTATFCFRPSGFITAPSGIIAPEVRSEYPTSANQRCDITFMARCCNASQSCNHLMCLCGCNGKLYNPQGFMVGSCPVALVCDIPYDSSTGTLCSNIVKLGDHNYIYSGVNTGETWNGEMQISNFDGFTICAKHPTCVSSSCNWPYAVACGNVTSLGVWARAASCSVAIGTSACAACVGSIAIGTCAISELDNGLAIGHGAKTEVVKKAGMNEKFGCILSDIHRGEFRDVAIAVHGLPYMKNCDFYNALSCRIQLSKDIATCCTYTIGCANCSLLVRGWCQNKPIKAIKHTVCANYCMITLIQENSESYIYSCSNSGISFPIYIEVTGLSV